MFGAKTGVATHINETRIHTHLTYCHVSALPSAVGKTIKATKIMRGTLDLAFELNKLIISYSMVLKSYKKII